MLTEANFNFHDLIDKLNIDMAAEASNVESVINDLVEPKF